MNELLMQRVDHKATQLAEDRGVRLGLYERSAIWRMARPLILDDGMKEDEAVEAAYVVVMRDRGQAPWAH